MPAKKNGKKAIPENTTRCLAEMQKLAESAKNPLVLIYGNPDPDALASALALKIILDTSDRKLTIGYTGVVGRPENASMIRQLKIPAVPVTEPDIEKVDLVALVDAQPQFFKGFALPRCDIVIDHHPMLLDREVPLADIRPGYLSTSSIMTEYMRAAHKRLTKRVASALYYGIKVDSRHFLDLSPGDVEAIRWLRGTADRDIVRRIEFSQFSEQALDYFSIALVRKRFERGVIFSHLGPVPATDVCVQVADFLIRVEQVSWALVTGVVGDTLVVVFRNDGMKKDAGTLARKAFGEIGSAGGHKSMGRAEIKQASLPEGLMLTDDCGVELFVLGSLARANTVFSAVLRSCKKSCGKPRR
jgi:nanoRNase/pAp phosphatase (c-di-AMP/oligoRNAs hydrolase)